MNLSGRELVLQSRQTWGRLTNGQRITFGMLIVGSVIAISLLMWWSSKPDYAVLFSGLNEQDGGKVINYLQESNIPYKFEMGGSTIKIPRENLYDTRLKLASLGLPEQKGVGYELFDKVNFGMSDFMQKLNYRRALEGELARTIISMDEVEAARVHLVMPEESLFKEKEKPITASVVLKLKSNHQLTQGQIQGLSFLVAGAVEGLSTEKVTIVDNKGNVLSNLMDRDPVAALSATQLQMQQQVEQSVIANLQSMLDRLLGQNKAIVRATAELDFKRIEEQRELYDNTNPAVRSEERTEATSSGGPSGNTNNENTVTNYEVSRTVQKIVNSTGGIKRLSLSVLIDGVYKKTGEGDDVKSEYQPRNDIEMTQIAKAIRGAVGFDSTRGDLLEISNVAFDVTQIEEQKEEFKQTERMEFWRMVIERGVLILGALIILFMIRGFLKRTAKSTQTALERTLVELSPRPPDQLGSGAMPASAGALMSGTDGFGRRTEEARKMLPDFDSEVSEEVAVMKQMQDQLEEFAMKKPESAARLLKSWLIE
ncbi:MAG: flagellar basal-body MS-ring/collar protein FliF [bacterium]|nr:flagellar basal-body MS-ring/collar protein FliF [bacterium]